MPIASSGAPRQKAGCSETGMRLTMKRVRCSERRPPGHRICQGMGDLTAFSSDIRLRRTDHVARSISPHSTGSRRANLSRSGDRRRTPSRRASSWRTPNGTWGGKSIFGTGSAQGTQWVGLQFANAQDIVVQFLGSSAKRMKRESGESPELPRSGEQVRKPKRHWAVGLGSLASRLSL